MIFISAHYSDSSSKWGAASLTKADLRFSTTIHGGTVCDDSFNNQAAGVVCNMLGFPRYVT